MNSNRLRSIPSLLILGLVVAVLNTAIFFLVSHLTLSDSTDAVRQGVREAFATGDLQLDPYPTFDTRIGRHQHNDCLILSYFFMPYSSPIERVVSPIAPFAGNACAALQNLAQGEPPGAETGYYHRYLHGHRVVAAALVEPFGVGGARSVLYYSCYGILFLGICGFLLRYAAPQRSPASRSLLSGHNGVEDLAAAALLVPFLLFYGLPYYGMSFSHGPADITLFVFLVGGLWFNLLTARAAVFAIVIATFACFTAYFEFLTGGAPIGVAALIGVLVVNSLRVQDAELLRSRIWSGIAIYIAAFIAVFAIKVVAAAIVFGPDVVTDFASQLKTRISGNYADSVDVEKTLAWGFDPRGHDTYSIYSVIFLVAKMVYSSSYLAYGSLLLGALLLVASGGGIVFMLIRQWRRPADKLGSARLWGLAASAAVIPGWYLLFLNHSIIHASFMIRISTWIMAAAAAMAILSYAGALSRVRSRGKVLAA